MLYMKATEFLKIVTQDVSYAWTKVRLLHLEIKRFSF